ncbi:MAG: nitrilase-related carbon-nitrogen hydrolase, partial [Planctomycetota bacterium]
MPRVVRAAIIQAANVEPADAPLERIRQSMIDKHVALIDRAADDGARVCCLQELFCGPYFPAEQDARWYGMAEPIPDGPTVRLMQDRARAAGLVLIVPVYEV